MRRFSMFLLCLLINLGHEGLYARKHGLDSLLQELPDQNEDTNKVRLLDEIANEFGEKYPDESIKYELQELKLAEKLNWNPGIANACNHLGEGYDLKRNFDVSLEYMHRAMNIYEQIGDTSHLFAAIKTVAVMFELRKEFDSALFYYEKDVNIGIKMNSDGYTESMYAHISHVYKTMHKPLKALEYCSKAREIDLTYESSNSNIATMNGIMGQAYLEMALEKKYRPDINANLPAGGKSILDSAIKYLELGIAGNKKKNLTNTEAFYRALTEAYKLSGNYTKALEAIELLHVIDDSISKQDNDEKNKIREEIVQLNENQLKQKNIQLNTEKKARIFFVGAIGLSLMLVIFIFKNFSNQKKANRLLSIEKKKSDDLLLNILPSEVAAELKNKGASDARLFDNVTVLFTDFVSFTKVAERLTPQELVRELDACFKAFDGITGKYHIEKIKTMGDAYLAVSGLPSPNPGHAENMINAAKEIAAFMVARHLELGNKTFEVRIGIHSGSVVAGIVGIKKFAYDIWGDTVNTAARMEQNSMPGRINISETTYELVKDKFTCEYRGEIEAKNKGMMKMYFVETHQI